MKAAKINYTGRPVSSTRIGGKRYFYIEPENNKFGGIFYPKFVYDRDDLNKICTLMAAITADELEEHKLEEETA